MSSARVLRFSCPLLGYATYGSSSGSVLAGASSDIVDLGVGDNIVVAVSCQLIWPLDHGTFKLTSACASPRPV